MKKQEFNEKDLDILLQYGLHQLDLRQASLLIFEQGEYLFREGEPMYYIYFVVSGKAKVFLHLSDGKQLLLAYFISKGIIGDVELAINRYTACTTIQAVTEFVCIALPLNIYADALQNNIAFVNHIAREIAEKLLKRSINGAITTLQPLEIRLCAYIFQTATNGIFRETLTEVAGLVGTSYRHLLRCLDKLCTDGVLRKEPCGYRIINEQALSTKAGDLYDLK